MSLRTIERFVEVGSTVGAVTAVLKSWTVPDSSAVEAQAVIVGRDTGSGDVAVLSKRAALRRVSGTLTVAGTVVDLITGVLDTSLATASATLAINGTAVELRVTGVIGRTIEWMGDLQIWVN